MKRFKGTAFVLSALIALLAAAHAGDYYPVFDGEKCYSVKDRENPLWVAKLCLDNYEDAVKKADAMNRLESFEQEIKKKTWVEVSR